jgi:hypothetical protein
VRARPQLSADVQPQAPAAQPAPAAALPAALDAATVMSLQQTSGNAAVSRLLQRSPAPPTGLTRDRSQVHIVPGRGAADPMDYVEFTSQEPRTEVVGGEAIQTEDAREFDYESGPRNLSATWRYYDGADRLVHTISDMPRAIAIWPASIREHVNRTGRSAFGAWTVRLEKDAYYDDVHFDVTEGARPAGAPLEGATTESSFNLRELPSASARRLGALTGQSVSIRASDMLAAYYGAPVTSTGPGAAPSTSRRKSAVERFARHYGFSVGGPSAAFPAQSAARAAMAQQVQLFARVWVERRDYWRTIDGTLRTDFVDPMTHVFLRWLDALATEVGAGTP